MEPTAAIEFLGIPVFDDDIFKLVMRFALNIVFLTIIVRLIYHGVTKSSEYFFAFIMVNVMVFMICFTLKKFELQLGMALGLFALFGILRYRTAPIPIREMTYLFVVIGIGVLNALANKKMSYVELVFTNLAIIGALFVLEYVTSFSKFSRKTIVYEKIDLVKPARRNELIADLKERTGLEIIRFEVGKIDFTRKSAQIKITYRKPKSDV